MSGALPGVRLVDIRMLDSRERGTASSALAAIDTVFKLSKDIPARARIVHLGFGTPVQTTDLNILDQCVQQLIQNDMTVVAPAGNSNRNTELFSPAHTPGIISCGSYDKNNKRSLFTNTGVQTLLAPGEGVISLLPGNKSGALSGSSVATAYVTGLIVLTLASMTSEELASQTFSPEALLHALILKSTNVGTGANPIIENIPPGHFNRSVFIPPA
jgi:subtilisin family serine protease